MTMLPQSQLNTKEASPAAVSGQARGTVGDSLLIFAGGLIVFMLTVAPEFVGLQARFAMFAQEMLRNGPSVFPTAYGRPYPDYPATSTVMIYLVTLLTGRVTPWAAAVPTAVVSSLVLVVTYRIGAMRSRAWGLAAVLFALLTVEFFSASREVTLDQYTSLAVAMCFYLVYSVDRMGGRRRLWLLLPIWIFGFAFRGPVGLVLPAAVVCGHYLWRRQWRFLGLAAISAAVTLGLCLVGLVTAAKLEGGEALAKAALEAQMTGRMHGRDEALISYWSRCFAAYALACPVAVLLLACRVRDILRRSSEDDSLLGSLAAWTFIVLAAMSVSAANKLRYMLPVVPAISLMASYPMVAVGCRGMLCGVRRWFLGFCLFLPACGGAAVLAITLFAWRVHSSWNIHSLGSLATLVLLAVLSARLRRRWTDLSSSALAAMAIAAAVFVTLRIGILDPIHYSLERTKPFVGQVEALYEKGPRALVFFRIGPDAEDVRFMVNLSEPLTPRFLQSFDELRDLPGGSYVLMNEQVFRSMPRVNADQMRLRGRGKIGHKDFVILAMDRQA